MITTVSTFRQLIGLALTGPSGLVCLLATLTIPLLKRMRHDFTVHNRIRSSTAALMWVDYLAYARLFADAMITPSPRLPRSLPRRAVGASMIASGAIASLLAVQQFAGLPQITGTNPGHLITRGIYRYSRNPQYVGLVVALTGLALLRPSARAFLLAAILAAVYGTWVPCEETYLERRFGARYVRYRRATPRWFGVPYRNTDTRRD